MLKNEVVMKRRIIEIDQEKCNGCGICAQACHEGAIEIENGKAKLTSETYCDGLGDCLPTCPTGAISFIEKDALPYDEQAVLENKNKKEKEHHLPCGCPGSNARTITHDECECHHHEHHHDHPKMISQLSQWPIQIRLVNENASYFDNAKLLIAADCTAYAYASFHEEFIRDHITLIGCPKLDDIDYSEKLTEIIKNNNIKSVTIVRMEVPCCGGLEMATKTALQQSGKFIPWKVVTVTIDGNLIED